ncbi:MAG: LCP family protein [Actinomycetota bacterium]|nr:LCP family protein [Actinomycetota bacterium]
MFLILMAALLSVFFTVFDGQLPEPAKELPEKVVLFFSNINPFSSKSDDTVTPSSRKLDDDPKRTIVLVLGINSESGKELIDGATVLSLDFSEESVNGISIPKDTFVAVPPLGFKRLSDVITLGDESKAIGAIQDLLGVKITGFVKLKAADYQTILTDQFEGIFDKDIGSDLSEADKTKIDSLITKTRSFDDIGIVPLPVKSYVVGNESYFEPIDDELEGLIERIWGIKVERVAKISVMVYNGSGIPGVAADAASKLINGGFEVIRSKNADNFDYKETEVWDYGQGSEAPQRILEILKVGKIVKKPVTQDIADVLVVIGHDYKPETQ